MGFLGSFMRTESSAIAARKRTPQAKASMQLGAKGESTQWGMNDYRSPIKLKALVARKAKYVILMRAFGR